MRYITIFLLALLGILTLAQEVIAQPPVTQFERINSVEPIVFEEAVADDPRSYAIAMAREYGLSDQVTEEMLTTINCESGFNPKAINRNENHTDGTTASFGIAQFNRGTFNTWAGEINLENGDPMNYQHALEIMAYAFSQGENYKKHWSCWRRFYQ